MFQGTAQPCHQFSGALPQNDLLLSKKKNGKSLVHLTSDHENQEVPFAPQRILELL
jgi:hypothetical protein